MFGMRKQSSEIWSTNQTEWMETNSIKKLTEISNKQKKEEQGLKIIWNKRKMLKELKYEFLFCKFKLLTHID
jgi:hypothetical protein